MDAMDFLQLLKREFKVENLHFSRGSQQTVQRIAFCGGAGDFLIGRAQAVGADLFFTGEIGYHYYFGHENELWLAALGHYQSERYTIDLLQRILQEQFPTLPTAMTRLTPIPYNIYKSHNDSIRCSPSLYIKESSEYLRLLLLYMRDCTTPINIYCTVITSLPTTQ